MLKLSPAEYVGRAQDGIWEAELERELSQLDESVRVEFLAAVLVAQEQHRLATDPWFRLARRVLSSAGARERLFRAGLDVANASTMRNWVQFVSQLGPRRTERLLESAVNEFPRGVAHARYWMPLVSTTGKARQGSSAAAESSVAPDGSLSLAPAGAPSSAPRVNAGIGPTPESDDGDDKNGQ
jgi:hypothetical protein